MYIEWNELQPNLNVERKTSEFAKLITSLTFWP